MSDYERNDILNAITRMLARREHSVVEIGRKLQQKGMPAALYQPIIEEFREAGIQSDARFAEAKVRSAAGKGVGELRLRRELEEHQIDSGTITLAFKEADIDFFSLARQVYEKKYRGSEPADFHERQKRMRFLAYRGFSQEQISFAIKGE